MEKHGRSIEYCNLYWKKKCLEVTIYTKAIMVIFEGIQTGHFLSVRMGKVIPHSGAKDRKCTGTNSENSGMIIFINYNQRSH